MKSGFIFLSICIPLYNVLVYCIAVVLEWSVAIMVGLSIVGSIAIGVLLYKFVLSPFSERYATMEKNMATIREREELRKNFVSEISDALRTPAENLNKDLKEIVNIVKMQSANSKKKEEEIIVKQEEELSRYAKLYDLGIERKKDESILKKSKLNFEDYQSDLVESTVPKALDEVEKLMKLIDDLVILLDIEQKAYISQAGKIDIDKVVNEVVDEYEKLLNEKRIDVIIDIEDNLYIEGAAERFKTLIRKLFDNAVRYSQNGKTVWINGDNINGYIVVSVKDEGIGISAEDQTKIFNRFYRGLNSVNLNPIGSGLGLSIAKHLAFLLDAEIKVKTAYGEGSTFSVIFKRGL